MCTLGRRVEERGRTITENMSYDLNLWAPLGLLGREGVSEHTITSEPVHTPSLTYFPVRMHMSSNHTSASASRLTLFVIVRIGSSHLPNKLLLTLTFSFSLHWQALSLTKRSVALPQPSSSCSHSFLQQTGIRTVVLPTQPRAPGASYSYLLEPQELRKQDESKLQGAYGTSFRSKAKANSHQVLEPLWYCVQTRKHCLHL